MGHEPDSDREHNEQVGQHDEITSMTSKKIVACESGCVKSKDCREVLKLEISKVTATIRRASLKRA
jgi:hypothetical protein